MTTAEKGKMPASVAAKIMRKGIERNVCVVNETHFSTFLLTWCIGSMHPAVRSLIQTAITSSKDIPKQLGSVAGPSNISLD